jgi:TonB family protein
MPEELNMPLSISRSIVIAFICLISGDVGANASGQTVALGSPGSSAQGAPRQGDGIQILSDTLGVDFSPYIKTIEPLMLKKYVQFLPEEAREPTFASGLTGVRFTINADGKLAPGQMHLDYSTHDQALDRAAWGAITSAQFPPLPANFTGPNLVIRVEFHVNQPKH